MILQNLTTSFDNEFDFINRDLSEIEIRETHAKDKCVVWDISDPQKSYNCFLLAKNTQSKIICDLTFHKSSTSKKYLPRPVFKRVSLDGNIKNTRSKDKVIVDLSNSNDAIIFWKFISFIKKYKEIVDLDDLESTFKVIAKDSYFIEFDTKTEKEKAKDIIELVRKSDLKSSDIRSIAFESRKKDLKIFYLLLKNKTLSNGKKSIDHYRSKYSIQPGEEAIWHHFLKNHDWILGLNLDLVFIKEFLDEQSVGNPNSSGSGNPKVDLLGMSHFTTLVELKHANTNIFKKSVSKGRANTWDFTSDFIEGISQCLGQVEEVTKSFDGKQYVDGDGVILDKRFIHNIDPQSIFIIGCRCREFPMYDADNDNLVKYKVFQRFRRNNRIVDVLTFDELFERSYYSVFDKRLEFRWWEMDEKDLFV
ncbi:Shedu anti-phage system protein SduA domain-containing protein [Neolewinella agarilytica]|uniref:Shedu protein SduA C-terminal domain-containing protein n=1 Tax=Neolewinella agarilytica TaxID=478744 RepID=A0A1H9LE84_9BACT|nr:Shedu anti-phage system protein SduA domain-containing protein [Neolewinella agarilytica]SER09736.1 protein of unknown function [Neolewinella agarilytica]